MDEAGDLYAIGLAALEAADAVTPAQLEAARLTAEARDAVQMALGYERVGQVCGPALTGSDEVVLAERRFSVLGSIGAM